MSELLPFCKIKLQYLQEMVTDPDLDDNALRVALYLALFHADHETGESRPSFETIGDAVGKHAKSVKRALNKVEAAGYMTVERGTNKGNSSRYRPTESALKRASERRREGDMIAPRTENKNLEKNTNAHSRRICLMRGNPAETAQRAKDWSSSREVSALFGTGMIGWGSWAWRRLSAACRCHHMLGNLGSGFSREHRHQRAIPNGSSSLVSCGI
ncbi:MAG: helix-turn-helix domain-containing protein [Paracoccus sp. (in: a-proteobacteria)]